MWWFLFQETTKIIELFSSGTVISGFAARVSGVSGVLCPWTFEDYDGLDDERTLEPNWTVLSLQSIMGLVYLSHGMLRIIE